MANSNGAPTGTHSWGCGRWIRTSSWKTSKCKIKCSSWHGRKLPLAVSKTIPRDRVIYQVELALSIVPLLRGLGKLLLYRNDRKFQARRNPFRRVRDTRGLHSAN